MNWDQIAGTWKEYQGKAKARWGEITDDEWTRAAGRRDELIGLIQQRYGHAKEAAAQEVDDWRRSL